MKVGEWNLLCNVHFEYGEFSRELLSTYFFLDNTDCWTQFVPKICVKFFIRNFIRVFHRLYFDLTDGSEFS